MKAILLGGQNILNREWVENIKKRLDSKFDEVLIQEYKHWQNNEPKADVVYESDQLLSTIGKIDGDYCVFAKSIGSVIFFNASKSLAHKPKFAILFGVPKQMAFEAGYDFVDLKNRVDFSVEIYQKRHDPFGNFEDLKVIAGKTVRVNEYVGPGEPDNDHDYANLEYIEALIANNL